MSATTPRKTRSRSRSISSCAARRRAPGPAAAIPVAPSFAVRPARATSSASFSWSSGPLKTRAKLICGGFTAITPVSEHRDWISQAARVCLRWAARRGRTRWPGRRTTPNGAGGFRADQAANFRPLIARNPERRRPRACRVEQHIGLGGIRIAQDAPARPVDHQIPRRKSPKAIATAFVGDVGHVFRLDERKA